MVKYKFAKLENGGVVSINAITDNLRSANDFFCIGCESQLIARLGKIMPKHFAHKKPCTSNKETYLHKAGKKIFRENYEESLISNNPIILEYNVNRICTCYKEVTDHECNYGIGVEEFNLTDRFKSIEEEFFFEGFKPDLRIFNDLESILIEIAVTHKSSDEKIASSHRIIEFQIEEEEDLELLKGKVIKMSDLKIKFYNFKRLSRKGDFCRQRELGCSEWYYLFTVNQKDEINIEEGRLVWFFADSWKLEQAKYYKFHPESKFKKWDKNQIKYELEQEYIKYCNRKKD